MKAKSNLDDPAIDRVYADLVAQGFPPRKLLHLVESSFLEHSLWPRLQDSDDISWTLLAAWILNTKKSIGYSTFQVLAADIDPEDERVTFLLQSAFRASLDEKLTFKVRTACLLLIIDAFGNLDIPIVQKTCQPIVSILCWRYLLPAKRDSMFAETPILKKRYKTRTKAMNSANNSDQKLLAFAAEYVHRLCLEIITLLNTQRTDDDTLAYCCRAIEFFTDILSQLPTRRYLIYLFQDLHISTAIKLSFRLSTGTSTQAIVLKSIVRRFDHYLTVPFDNIAGQEMTLMQIRESSVLNISRLQQMAYAEFKDKLLLLALSNQATIDVKAELRLHLEGLTEIELKRLCDALAIKTSFPVGVLLQMDRRFLTEAMLQNYERPWPYRAIISTAALFPTEKTLFPDQYNLQIKGMFDLLLPKLTLQYLSINDFLERVSEIHQASFFAGVRSDMIAGLQRLTPQIVYPSRTINYRGQSKNVLSIDPPAILEVSAPKIGSPGHPALVRAEVKLDLEEVSSSVKSEWLNLTEGDLVYFLHLEPSDDTSDQLPNPDDAEFARKMGISSVRCAVVESMHDADGRAIRARQDGNNTDSSKDNRRLLRILLDPVAFQKDREEVRLEEVYEKFNLLLKRRSAPNSDLSITRTVKRLCRDQKTVLPEWLVDSFLGLGMPSQENGSPGTAHLCLYDSFIDLSHARQVLPGLDAEGSITEEPAESSGEDYSKLTNPVLRQMLEERGQSTLGKKSELLSRLAEVEVSPGSHANNSHQQQQPGDQSFTLCRNMAGGLQDGIDPAEKIDKSGKASWQQVRCEQIQSRGPYASNRSRRNEIRFSSAQLQAICAGTAPGLALIDGASGSGKGLITAQILNNIYHNESEKRTLVLCQTDQNLDTLVARLRKLDINHAHILGLRSTTDKTDTSGVGLTEVLTQKAALLTRVSELASSLDISGDHGASCETAAYFYSTFVVPRFEEMSNLQGKDSEQTGASPFDRFFSDAEPPNDSSTKDDLYKSYQTYIENIFSLLAEFRPMELLKSRDLQELHLLTKSARIIVTTASHLIQEHAKLAPLGIAFQSILVDQASSMTDFEAISPFTFVEDPTQISRFVLIGDSQQIKPTAVSKHPSIVSATNANQSLFIRLLRSGNTVVKLNEQGRSRPSLAALYQHRYTQLTPLPNIASAAFSQANAGFAHTAQFIEVSNYNGQGEFSPRLNVWQNLGEAEYVVALYQYMRLLGYPIGSIVLLALFEGQKALIQDILDARCRQNTFFGIPLVATVGEYQSQESDYVLLSLVRTTSGELLDLNCMTTALSRAKLGLYVFGRRSAMSSLLNPFLSGLDVAPFGKLELVTGEMYPTSRLASTSASERGGGGSAVMEGVEHLGQYVYEMTQKRISHSSL